MNKITDLAGLKDGKKLSDPTIEDFFKKIEARLTKLYDLTKSREQFVSANEEIKQTYQ